MQGNAQSTRKAKSSSSSSAAKQGPAWSGKQGGGKSKLVVVDENSSSTDSSASPPSRSAEKRRLRAERKAARKREGEGEQSVLVQVEVPQGDHPDAVLDRMLAEQRQPPPQRPPQPTFDSLQLAADLVHGDCASALCVVPEVCTPIPILSGHVPQPVPRFAHTVPIPVPACVAATAQRLATSPSLPPTNANAIDGLNLDAVCNLLRSTVQDSMRGVQQNIVSLEQRLLESISTLESRVRTLEANAGPAVPSSVPVQPSFPPVAGHRSTDSIGAAGHPQSARSQSLYATSRAGGVSASLTGERKRSRSMPRTSVEAYSFFNPERTSVPSSQGPASGNDTQEWRKRTVVLSGFETRRTIQEFKAIAGVQLRIPEGAKLLTRSKFASVCSIEFESQVQARQLIEDFKSSARIVDQRRVFANPSLPPAAARSLVEEVGCFGLRGDVCWRMMTSESAYILTTALQTSTVHPMESHHTWSPIQLALWRSFKH
eukprot:2252498-Amphidinium_carterae.1